MKRLKTHGSTHQSHHFDFGNLSLELKEKCLADDARIFESLQRQKLGFITDDAKAKDYRQQTETERLKQEFEDLVAEWASTIKYKSLESQQINHSTFLRIVVIADKVLPSVFEEFSKRPFMAWLKALPAIVGKDVASEAESFPEAVQLWVDWAKENDYLPK